MYLLNHLLTASSIKYPDKDAVIFKNTSISYSDLESQSNELASVLIRWGVKHGDRVGILLNKSIESIVSLFGIMKAGAIYVPIDPLAPPVRSKYIITNCAIECLITSLKGISDILAEGYADLPLRKVIIVGSSINYSNCLLSDFECITWEEIWHGVSFDLNTVCVTDVDPAYILHTSGSTGTPKGVVISHRNALSFVDMATDFFEIRVDDRIASHAPLHFDLSVFDIFGAVKKGATILPVPEFLSTFPVKLAEFINNEGISIWNSVASVLTMLADKGRLERFAFDSLRLIHFSGDLMPAKYLRVLRKHFKKTAIFNIYGQTEANSSMFYPIGEIPGDNAWKIPIGKPFPNFDVFLLNDCNELVAHPGEEGELVVKSSTVALGYWGDEDKTRDKFVQETGNSVFRSIVYKTGDIVRTDKDGNYQFVGRKDHMIKSRGYRVELNEIELLLSGYPLIGQAVVIAVPDELIGNRIIAYVAKSEKGSIDVDQLLIHCSQFLPKYMVPESVEILDDLPRTSTGKIDRKFLEEMYKAQYSDTST
ncbi:MAG: carbohydrate-binding protein [Geobacter sp.]|nr:MAG: carbohydrate-binding protein [Geobacter sp.]